MESHTDQPPLIVIVGPTASGKTSLAIDLAKQFNGEIVCADSRTVYEGMDIGTAKPSAQELAQVPHHLLDITTPDKPITAAEFKSLALHAIQKIHSKGKVPFLVGGTGLYIDAVIFNYSFRSKPDEALRQQLNALSVGQLQEKAVTRGYSLPQNPSNKRHLIRILESNGETGTRHDLRDKTLILGMQVEKSQLEARLAHRLNMMLQRGLEQEIRKLLSKYGWDCQALQAIGYQEFKPYFERQCGLAEVTNAILQHSLQYAKRQKTWFKRNKHIHYIYKVDESVDLITTFLNKKV